MQLSHQLVPKLKNLRLSGILATLDVRTQQAITEKLSYVDFLERLVEDEVERRGQKQLQLRLRRATVDLGTATRLSDLAMCQKAPLSTPPLS